MLRYALLLIPSTNRVYADAAGRLARAELEIFAGSGVLDAAPVKVAVERIGGVEYLTFAAPEPGLDGRDLAYTLNQALMYGYDGIGVEHDGKDIDAYAAFLRTWLRRKRLKHTAGTVPVRRDRRLVARRFEAVLAVARDEHRAGATQRVTVLHTDTTRAREVLRPRCADVIVTDAPYGVAHGSRTEQCLSRSPLDLLTAAVPVWRELLRPGGALGLSWNTHVAPRAVAGAVLAGAGLRVVDGPGYLGLAHRVDQAIERDVLVAVVPGDDPNPARLTPRSYADFSSARRAATTTSARRV